MEESGAEHQPEHERLLCSPNHRAGWIRGGIRVPESGYGENVRHEGILFLKFTSPSQFQRERGNLASGLSLKSHRPPTPHHPKLEGF